MSMISDLVDRLETESKSMGKYGTDYMATLLMQASATIITLSEKARADRPQGEWIPCTKRGLPLTELGRRERQEWYGYKCSKCNFIYKGNALTESPFCQNCGADMKGMDDVV